jgi:hypothetical protein
MRVGLDVLRSSIHQTVLDFASKSVPRVISTNLSQVTAVHVPTQVVAVIFSFSNAGFFVINLVPQHYPDKFRLLFTRRRVQPMRDRRVLHPTNVSDIIDVTLLVNIGGGNDKRM